MGANPNVAAAVVIGIEPDWTNVVVEGIKKTGKPVTGFDIERHGDLATIAAASRQAKEYLQWASELRRVEVDLSEIWVSVKCGESDTTSGLASNPTVGNAIDKLVAVGATTSFGETSEITGAEMVCKERAATPAVGEQFYQIWKDYDDFIQANKTDDLSGSQPTKGNIRGGLTTIEEKAFGNLQKIGKKSKYVGVLAPAETPTGPGLWFMDTSSGRGPGGHLVGRGRFRGAPLPHRPGQHLRQPHPAGHQALRQPLDREDHVRAHRLRLLGHPARRIDPGSVG